MVVPNLVVELIGAAIGALLGAVTLRFATRKVAGYAPLYWRAYQTTIAGYAVSLIVSFVLVLIINGADQKIDASAIILMTVVGFFVQTATYAAMLKDSANEALGFRRACLVSLVQVVFGVIIIAAIVGSIWALAPFMEESPIATNFRQTVAVSAPYPDSGGFSSAEPTTPQDSIQTPTPSTQTFTPTLAPAQIPTPTPSPIPPPPKPADVELSPDDLKLVEGLAVKDNEGFVSVHNNSTWTLTSVDFVVEVHDEINSAKRKTFRYHATNEAGAAPYVASRFRFTPFDNDAIIKGLRFYQPYIGWRIVSAQGSKPK